LAHACLQVYHSNFGKKPKIKKGLRASSPQSDKDFLKLNLEARYCKSYYSVVKMAQNAVITLTSLNIFSSCEFG
jgi:hypothetical protein